MAKNRMALEGELSATYENKTDAATKYGSRVRDANDTFQLWTRRIDLRDLASSPGSMINLEHNANGDGPTDPSAKNETYALDIHNNPGAPPAFVIHQYSDKLQALRIDNTDISPSIVVFNTQNQVRNPGKTGSGDFLYLSDLMNNTLRMRVMGTGAVQIISEDASNSGMNILNKSNRNALRLDQQGNEVALNILTSAASTGKYPVLVSGQDYGPQFITSLDGGQTLRLTKNATGASEVLRIVNNGTGASLSIRNGASAELFTITAAGLPKWTAAANQQTTVGAAGAASALPATPTKYLKVQDSAGTTYVIPAYAAS